MKEKSEGYLVAEEKSVAAFAKERTKDKRWDNKYTQGRWWSEKMLWGGNRP